MPEKIYNMDESVFPLDPKRIKVLCERGISHLFHLISGSGRDSITVQGCVWADGFMLPPYILYAAKNLRVYWTTNGPAGAEYNVSEKGWMNTTSFYDWFTNFFIPLLLEGRPVVLIMNGHASHLSIATIKATVDNGVILLKLPPNFTHAL